MTRKERKQLQVLINAYKMTMFFCTQDVAENNRTPEDYRLEGKVEVYKGVVEDLNNLITNKRR